MVKMGYITTDSLARLGGIKITIGSEWHKEKNICDTAMYYSNTILGGWFYHLV